MNNKSFSSIVAASGGVVYLFVRRYFPEHQEPIVIYKQLAVMVILCMLIGLVVAEVSKRKAMRGDSLTDKKSADLSKAMVPPAAKFTKSQKILYSLMGVIIFLVALIGDAISPVVQVK